MGYYPYYRTGSVNQIQYDKMTDLIYAFLNADNSGNLRLTGDVFNQPNFNQIVTAARASNPNIRIHISSGGGGLSAWFPAVAGNAANRANFCTQMANFIQTNNLDGWDLDWEFPGTSTVNKNAHEELLKDMKAALDAKGLVMCKKLDVSMAVGGETNLAITNPTHADYYNPGAINYVD